MATEGADQSPIILWFRRDLRLADNDAAFTAAKSGAPVIPVYVLDRRRPREAGGAHLWWLDKSLRALASDLAKAGSPLILREGDTVEVLLNLARQAGASIILAGRLHSPGERSIEEDLAQAAQSAGIELRLSRSGLLTEPGEVRNGAGEGYKVFTPYMRALRAQVGDVRLTPAVRTLKPHGVALHSDRIDDWALHPATPDWSSGFDWAPSEKAAHAALSDFVGAGLRDYPAARNRPDADGSSRLSPHLHWGELSSRQVWAAARAAGEARHWEDATDKFLAEIGWRDFSHQVLWHHPSLMDDTFNPRLKPLKWLADKPGFDAWSKGRTGFPIVDAGMRQLWVSGWMHNRVRMIVASFLSKDLLIDWREGERWFWDCLVDGDEANNAMNWQWVAGTGPDAQPFFRVFNPVGQGEKFDPEGAYVRRWVPELAKLSDTLIHRPWEASDADLRAAGVVLGDTYPKPLVDHAVARDRALAAYKQAAPPGT